MWRNKYLGLCNNQHSTSGKQIMVNNIVGKNVISKEFYPNMQFIIMLFYLAN